MKTYQVLLFDLDGTLTDPYEGITKSVQYALRHFGIEVEDRRVLAPLIGPPLQDTFHQLYGFSEEKTRQAIAKYREYFSTVGIYENTVYPGVPELLENLKNHQKTLVLATSKPQIFATRILKHFGLDGYFTFIAGSELDGYRSKKADVITYALEQAGVTDPAASLMIGDREHDILGAKQVGIDAAGVLYGYGSREELSAAGADFIAESPQELATLLLY